MKRHDHRQGKKFMMKKVIFVAGARPNFMKIAPLLREVAADYDGRITPVLVHTGQHYDENMSQRFFSSLGIKEPDYNLQAGSGTHSRQTASVMVHFEEVCLKEKPQAVVVVGDVNSTIAAGLVAKKLQMLLVHVEAGLRSGDRTMPEEINRLATDAITDLFFTTEKQGKENLLREGQPRDRVHFVGHVMIDNLFYQLEFLDAKQLDPAIVSLKKRLPERYFCLTLHRPSNVDQEEVLGPLLQCLHQIAAEIPVVFPCHPRTRKQIERFQLIGLFQEANDSKEPIENGMLLLDPLGYDEFLSLWKDAKAVLTDSGGLQEETTALKLPCITLRDNTERPITVELGTNVLAGNKPEVVKEQVRRVLSGETKEGKVPEFWDGRASERIVDILYKAL